MTPEQGRGSVGGRANEAGSAHRAGVAAYLAAHGLAGLPLPIADDDSFGPPEGLWLEWSGDVDDLWCGFSGGRRWELQAKRRCNWDAACFSKVVAQWVSAARSGDYTDGDRLALVAGQMSAPLKDLREALRRGRRSSEAELLPREKTAHNRFRDQAVSGGWLDVFPQIIASSMILELEVETAAQAGFREAANVLDGVVVARGSGVSAMNALARFFQTEAVRSGSSGPTDWLRVLDEAGIPPGPSSEYAIAGAARAIAAYKGRLVQRKDMLDVDLLGGGVPPMEIPDLLGTFEVSLPDPADESRPEKSHLADLARRWRRFVIVGLPGSGKTTALEQLAAAWADDAHAPLPVLVRLHRTVAILRQRQRLQVEDWCSLGHEVTPDVVPLLADRLRRGGAAIFLDGLDECRDQQGRAAAEIRSLAEELSADSSIILSVREVASDVAISTELPLTRLQEPQHLRYVVGNLVDHVVKSDPGTVDNIAARRDWVEVSRSLHPDVWSVPLFAVLLAVHAARAPSSNLPTTRAEALVAAIEDSVRRWEREKAHEPSSWDRDLEPGMLLDAFGVIGHEVMLGQKTVADCKNIVATALAEPWGLAPAQSRAIADDVHTWWSERVGAFVVESGELKPRLRMFGEVGDAMWAARGPSEDRDDWLRRVLQDPEKYREPALLAAALNVELANQFIETADSPAAVLLAADSVAQGANPSATALAVLLQRLGAFFNDPPPERHRDEADDVSALVAQLADRRSGSDGPGWDFGLRVARLPLPQDLRPLRDSFLNYVEGVERHGVAFALAAAADCAFDGRDPDEDERRVLQSVLELPLPAKEPPRPRRSRRVDPIEISSGPPILTGRAEAAMEAIRLVGLTTETADAASDLAERVWVDESEQLRTAIRAAGFPDALARSRETEFGRTLEAVLGSDPYLHTRFILTVAAELARYPAVWSEPWREWRLDAVAALFEVLDEGPRPLGAGPAAVREAPDLVRRLVKMAAEATGFSLPIVAAECRRAFQMLEDDALSTSVLLHVPADPGRTSTPGVPVIRDEDLGDLAGCLKSRNPLLFWPAALWLDQARRPELLDVFWDALGDMWGEHRYIVAEWLPEATGRTNVYRRWIEEHDPILRVVAARKLGSVAADISAIDLLLRDDDMVVRVETLRSLSESHRDLLAEAARVAVSEPPLIWTCLECGSEQPIETWDCTNCSRGGRRSLEEEIDHLTSGLGHASSDT